MFLLFRAFCSPQDQTFWMFPYAVIVFRRLNYCLHCYPAFIAPCWMNWNAKKEKKWQQKLRRTAFEQRLPKPFIAVGGICRCSPPLWVGWQQEVSRRQPAPATFQRRQSDDLTAACFFLSLLWVSPSLIFHLSLTHTVALRTNCRAELCRLTRIIPPGEVAPKVFNQTLDKNFPHCTKTQT